MSKLHNIQNEAVTKKSTNQLRKRGYLRSIEVHNKLVGIQEKTGMNFYLDGHPWFAGRIEIR